MKCAFCEKEFVPRRSTAKFCSPACKLKANRKGVVAPKGIISKEDLPHVGEPSRIQPYIKKSPQLDVIMPEMDNIIKLAESQDPPSHLSETDQLFDAHQPNYYIFDHEEVTRWCALCGKDFKTQLQNLRFCSPEHQKDVMVVIANGPHKNHKA